MSIETEIQRWLKSEEFVAFYQKAEYAMALIMESKDGDYEYIRPYLVEMGRRYNHFLFTVTEDIIKKAGENTTLTTEEVASATKHFIDKLEMAMAKEYPLVFSFFLKYRENLQKTASL